MIKKAFGYITHPFKRLSFKIKYKCRFNSAHKKISRKQNKKNPEVSLVITGGGLGDFFVNLPMIQSIVDSNRKVVVLTPFMSGYRPQFFLRTTDVTGNIELAPGVEMIMPGDNAKIIVELIYPVAMEEGLRFAIREWGRTVGAGVVTKVIE